MCGGTSNPSIDRAVQHGLSPRVRGNLLHRNILRLLQRGSIPACAGEPKPACPSPSRNRVYPRVCGGTPMSRISLLGIGGLSPRVRGNLRIAPHQVQHHRSIPACAGEPRGLRPASTRCPVYPRVCGGTLNIASPPSVQPGLSPRVRGNLVRRGKLCAGSGSIPACAGEPDVKPLKSSYQRVYPRVCGGTSQVRGRRSCLRGLSPRVRGNRVPHGGEHLPQGSIPACAGEPPPDWAAGGLSPRVRGNRNGRPGKEGRSGSIPACAGEPN